MKSVSVVGLGKLGLPMAALYAAKAGVDVIGVDVDRQRVEEVNQQKAGLNEPGLSDMIERAAYRLKATTDLISAVRLTEATFIIVPTPTIEATGEYNLAYVLDVCCGIGRALKEKAGYHLVVIVSTVMPGDTRTRILPVLETFSGKKCGEDFGLCYSPEFIALGNVLHGLQNPDFILIGESDRYAGRQLNRFYQVILEQYAETCFMSFENAELAKLAINTYVTTKIAFANMLAAMCEKLPTGDVGTVTLAMGCDTRIGNKSLQGGTPFGGPCFPRDNRALAVAASRLDLDAAIPRTVDMVNLDYHYHLLKRVREHAPQGRTIGVLGLAYKPSTDVTEESFGLWLTQMLTNDGHTVLGFDPLVKHETFINHWGESIDVDVLVVTLPGLLRQVEIKRADVLINCWRDTPLQPVGKRIDVGVNVEEEKVLA